MQVKRMPSASSGSPEIGDENDDASICISFLRSEPAAVYRRATWERGSSGLRGKSSWTSMGTRTLGWSRRFWPTPGTSSTIGIPRSLKTLAGPTPESINNWGEPMAPEVRMISEPSTVNRSPSLSTSTPTARLPSKITRWVVTLGLIVRFRRCRASAR